MPWHGGLQPGGIELLTSDEIRNKKYWSNNPNGTKSLMLK